MNSYQPLEDRVIVKEIKKTDPETTAGGIITDMVKKPTKEGEVVSVGVGRYATETGAFMPTVLHKGDIVLYGAEHGMPIDIPNTEGGKDQCVLMREGDILIFIGKKDSDKS